ncbi:MAG: glycosyltransferase family 2 protein [Verrucomicrobia bacterium]|nr:glycosyltransferase family 2 protein [Verrucomicrobiota bacterium]
MIPTRDKANLQHRCVQGVLLRTDYHNMELPVIDNGSVEAATHELFERLIADDSRVRVSKRPGSFNYSARNESAG